ncbi:MAG: hypothetical protein JWM97_313 [Phycisphaerales bacterium]|nr:hypothetical protein [Phycisphaerales bacterium]
MSNAVASRSGIGVASAFAQLGGAFRRRGAAGPGALAAVTLALLLISASVVRANEALASSSANRRWHSPEKSATATYLGNDQKDSALLVLRKSAVLGTELQIQSNASAISFVSGEIKVTFPVDQVADGAVVKLKLEGGDNPALYVNGKEQPRNRGKWIELVNSPESNFTVVLADVSFATVTFGEKAPAPKAASPAAEPASREPAVAAAKEPKELLRNVTPQKLKAATKDFAGGVSSACPRCSGSGKITASVQTGTRREGAILRKVYRDETHTCDRCKGAGRVRVTDEVLNRFADNFVRHLAGLKQDDPKSQDAISNAYKMITDSMIGDHKTWVLLTENGRSILSQKAPTVGTPVIAKVLVKDALPVVDGKRRFMVEIGGTDKRVLVLDPVSADEVKSGPALMGGLVESPDKLAGNEHPVAIVQHGFLVAPPIEKGWWWWYWWRGDRPRGE